MEPPSPLSLKIGRRTDAVLTNPAAFYAAEEKAREAHFRQMEQDSLRGAAKYDGFVPDETGLPPEVKPIQPKANAENGGQRGQRRRAPKANGKNGGRRPARAEAPELGPAAPKKTAGAGRPPSANRFIEGLPDWCPPIPVSDEPFTDPEPPSPFGTNERMRPDEPGPEPSSPPRLPSADGQPPSPFGKNGEATG